MVVIQKRSKRKKTGGRYKAIKTRRQHASGSIPTLTRLGDKKIKRVSTVSKNNKTRVMLHNTANVIDPKTKKAKSVTIKTILENPANKHFVRRNIMTKGTIIDTDAGKARVTSRPGQDGTVNAVLI